jgi:hypothetical protein
MLYMPNFIKTSSGVLKLLGEVKHADIKLER